MDTRDYIDADEGREDITASVAVHVCENCGKACEELIELAGWNYKACADCAAEAAREDAREAAANSVKWVLSRTAPHFVPRYASIGNGLYVRTASPKKRRTR